MTTAETGAEEAKSISNQKANLKPSHEESRQAEIAAEDMSEAKSIKEKGVNEVIKLKLA